MTPGEVGSISGDSENLEEPWGVEGFGFRAYRGVRAFRGCAREGRWDAFHLPSCPTATGEAQQPSRSDVARDPDRKTPKPLSPKP